MFVEQYLEMFFSAELFCVEGVGTVSVLPCKMHLVGLMSGLILKR